MQKNEPTELICSELLYIYTIMMKYRIGMEYASRGEETRQNAVGALEKIREDSSLTQSVITLTCGCRVASHSMNYLSHMLSVAQDAGHQWTKWPGASPLQA